MYNWEDAYYTVHYNQDHSCLALVVMHHVLDILPVGRTQSPGCRLRFKAEFVGAEIAKCTQTARHAKLACSAVTVAHTA